jgi:GrpB-like predicted nucleotidyltransferase (UPF0157 family)
MTQPPGPEFLVPRESSPQLFLSEPDEAWAVQYAVEETLIRDALGGTLRSIEHAGSTAVPGLPAKPVVDVLLTVADPADEASYVQPLESAGYTFHHREPHWHEHRLFKKGTPHFSSDRPEDQPRVNLHVFPDGCEEVRRMLAFRDWLRAHPDDRHLYAETKRRLAAQPWERVQDYADAKTEVVTEIMQRALRASAQAASAAAQAAQPSNGEGSPAPTRTTSG